MATRGIRRVNVLQERSVQTLNTSPRHVACGVKYYNVIRRFQRRPMKSIIPFTSNQKQPSYCTRVRVCTITTNYSRSYHGGGKPRYRKFPKTDKLCDFIACDKLIERYNLICAYGRVCYHRRGYSISRGPGGPTTIYAVICAWNCRQRPR